MTVFPESEKQLTVKDVVRFRSDLFFDGAVQLRWVDEAPERAIKAAGNFVFHGPRYHAVRREDSADGYLLRDTATFSTKLIEDLAQGEDRVGNPFSLAIAGYGSGKSHLAVTLAELLKDPKGPLANRLVEDVLHADSTVGTRFSDALQRLSKPVLTVPLDGMTNFNLGSEVAKTIILRLREAGCDITDVEELSPRFQSAENFVARNFEIRKAEFDSLLPSLSPDDVIERLKEHDEEVYSAVDQIFENANGAHIPVEGRESIQDLIATVTSVYCGKNGAFSGLLILFDEFGRFLEYAAEQPHLAGDSALQQLFQGVQDSEGRGRFLGFIQYDLKAYVSRLDRRDLMHLQRYITRFEASEKSYLSTNLETLFAHILEKQRPDFVEKSVATGSDLTRTHYLFRQALPQSEGLPVWGEVEQFRDVICRGCWPLNPLAVWFLTRQQDVVQSRSALNIVKDAIDRINDKPAIGEGNGVVSISAAELLLTGMLTEFVAAEQARGGTIAETLQAILEERGAHLKQNDKRVLAGAAVLLKLRVRLPRKDDYEEFLALAAGLNASDTRQSLDYSVNDLGVMEWNDDFGQYELIQDAATRGQFAKLLRSRCADPAAKDLGALFINYGRVLCNLGEVDPGFASTHQITTQDWRFSPIFASSSTLSSSVATAFRDWRYASEVNEPKGRAIYMYLAADEDLEMVQSGIRKIFVSELKKYENASAAPIWVILIQDTEGRLGEGLQRWWALERGLTEQEKDRYRRFVAAEGNQVATVAQEEALKGLTARIHEIAGFPESPDGRLSTVGRKVFERIYSKVIPFPFDGFATLTGAGGQAKKDCLEISRAFITGEVDGEWVQSRPVRLRNRATHVLAQSWQVFDQEGNLAANPANANVAAMLNTMDDWHQTDPSRTLEQTRKRLIDAPYGCNLASSALLIGLFMARKRPRRRLIFDGAPCHTVAWIQEAFKTNELNSKVLSQTTVGFIAEDTHQRWQNLLEDWRNASRHKLRLEYLKQAKLLEQDGAVSEEFLYQYEKLRDEAAKSREAIASFNKRMDDSQRELERALKNSTSITALAICDRLLKLDDIVTNGEWEQEQEAEVEGLLGVIKQWVTQEGVRWIERSFCRSPQQVGEYRQMMEKAIATLTALDLAKLAEAAEKQKTYSISTVEERFRFQIILTEAEQFLAICETSTNRPISALNAVRVRSEQLSAALEKARERLSDPEIDEVIAQLRIKADATTGMISTHRRSLEQLYESSIDSLDSAKELYSRVSRLMELFHDQRDSGDIEDARKQLEKILADFETWLSVERTPRECDESIKDLMENQVSKLNQWCEDEGIEPLWSFEAVYKSFFESQIKQKKEQSELWLRGFLQVSNGLEDLSLSECQRNTQLLKADLPVFLSEADLNTVEDIDRKLTERIKLIEANRALEESRRWIESFSEIEENLTTLSDVECKQILRRLEKNPDFLTDADKTEAHNLKLLVERRLDELDISDIFERVLCLKETQIRNLFLKIKSIKNIELEGS